MELTLKMFLVVCPLVFLGSFMDAIAGGGGLITLPAYLLAGLPVHLSIGSNKLSSAIGTAVSTGRYWKSSAVDKTLVLPTVILGLVGSWLGAELSLVTDERIMQGLLLVVLPIAAFLVLRNKDFTCKREPSRRTQLIVASLASFFIGGYDGFYGPGTGTFLIMVFTMVCGIGLLEASGNAKVVNLASNVAALFAYLKSGEVAVVLSLVAAVFSIAGHWLGSGMVLKNGTKIVRPIVLVVMAILFVKIITELI